MVAVLLFTIMAVCLMLAIHPFATYPLSLAIMKRLIKKGPAIAKRDHAPGLSNPQFAVFVCAYNEAKVIATTLQRLIDLKTYEPGLEIMVHIDASTDGTAEIARQFESELTLLVVSSERRGKTEGMNLLVERSKADILVFTDASVEIDPHAFAHFREHFRDQSVGAVCGKQTFTHGEGSVNAGSNALYWRIEENIKRLEGELGSIMTLDGSLYALRRELRTPPPPDIVDDFYIPFMIIRDGYRVIQSDLAKSRERAVTDSKEEFKRKIRIACQGFNAHRIVWPVVKSLDWLTCYMYLSHKFIRWFTIYLLFLGLLFGSAGLIVVDMHGIVAVALVSLTAAGFLGGVLGIKPFSTLTNVLMAFAGAGLGVWQSISGQRYQVWEPPASVRQNGGI